MTKINYSVPSSESKFNDEIVLQDTYIPQNNEEWYHPWYELLPCSKKKQKDRQTQILTVISELYKLKGQKPTIKEIKQAAKCHHDTVKTALAVFEQQLFAEQQKQRLLISITNNKRLSKVINPNLQQLLDNATYALYQLCPNTVHLLSFVCPGNTEDSYLVIARNSKLIISELIAELKLLLPQDFKFYYLYAWEIQVRGSAHLHVLCNLPHNHNFTNEKLSSAWLSLISRIGSGYNINVYANSNIPDYSKNNADVIAHVANITKFPFIKKPEYEWSYLAKKESKTARVLSIAGNKAVGFQKWGGVSDTLFV